jgi:aminomethyltransferase
MSQRTVLFDVQSAAGGKIIDFHGWQMPVQFAGITAEHQAVRTAAGTFDLGHMGRLRLDGPGAVKFLERHCTRRLADMKPGVVRYALVLAEDGTVEDDILVSRESVDSFHVVVNGANRVKILGLWKADLPADVHLADISADQAMLACQGPRAMDRLAGLGLDGRSLKNYAFLDATWEGLPVRISRTGYTGEDGAELFIAAEHAPRLWKAVVAAGCQPCGLGCRDTLRLEAGMPLYGNELDRSVTPVEAGLGFAVRAEGGFIGAGRVLGHLNAGPPRKLVGIEVHDRRVPRHGYQILHNDAPVGVVTSGTLSPTLGKAIGMAYVPAELAATGTRVIVDIRGSRCAADIVPLPFYKRAR